MPIRVEFYGIARHRAGRSELQVPISSGQTTLGHVLALLDAAVPGLGSELLADNSPRLLAMNLDGNRFISDPQTPIHSGQTLLILSADAGG